MPDEFNEISGLDRTKITFAQAEGVDPLPTALKRTEISPQLAALLWKIIYYSLERSKRTVNYNRPVIVAPWLDIVFDWWTLHEHKYPDDFSKLHEYWIKYVKGLVTSRNYVQTFEFVTFIIRHEQCPEILPKRVADALEEARAAYRLVDKTLIPSGSPEETESISRAFVDVTEKGFEGARSHLRQSVEAVNRGDYASSIRESIHAVESVAKKLDPNASTLGPALKTLTTRGKVHGSLQAGFEKLYGFTSDEQGVRHALIDDPVADVDEADALYMLGACAAFVSYLIRKTAD